MGKIVVTEFISLDGVIEDPGGSEDYRHGGWTFEIDRGEEGNKFKLDELFEAEAQLLGRVTYEGFAAACRSEKILSGDLADEVARLHREIDGTILVAGSAQLVRGLLDSKVVGDGATVLTYEPATA